MSKELTQKELIEYLIEKGIYQEVDRVLVDDYIYNLKLSKQAKTEITKNGSIMNVSKDPQKPYYQQNPAVSILNQCTKNLLNLSRKLALSPYDRANLNINIENDDDEFDD